MSNRRAPTPSPANSDANSNANSNANSDANPLDRRRLLGWGVRGAGLALAASYAGCGDGSPGGSGADAQASSDAPPVSDARLDGDGAICAPTRSDALGPFFEAGAPMRMQLADIDEPGERLALRAQIFDQDCVTPLAGVLVDVWQADREGDYHDAGVEYRLRGQVVTDATGTFNIETIRPGNYQLGPGLWRPAHVHFMFTKPGFVSFPTQIYFAGDIYLAPNDDCTSCGSDDLERIVDLAGDANAGWSGDFRVVLART